MQTFWLVATDGKRPDFTGSDNEMDATVAPSNAAAASAVPPDDVTTKGGATRNGFTPISMV